MIPGRISDRIERFWMAREGKKRGLYFYFREIFSEPGTEVVLKGGRKVLMLGSNSYMGLTNHPEIKEAAKKAVEKYGTGCSGSRFLNGTLDLHIELETELADWVGKEAALLFPTGFQVNQGVIATILNRNDCVLMDVDNHASIVDGARLSMARVIRFPHNDMVKLDYVLENEIPEGKAKLIVADGVFSMGGGIAKISEMVSLAEKYEAALMIDDAHGLGVFGAEGSGTVSHFGLTEKVDFIMGTFSKSLASIGGFIAGDARTIDYIKHHSRAFIFSASLPAASVAAVLSAVKIIRREPERIERLWNNTRMMKQGLDSMGYDTGGSKTPIIPVYIGDPLTLMTMCKHREEKGLFVNPVLPPAVLPNRSMFRVSLMATHTTSQIAFALEVFEKIGKEINFLKN